MHPARRAWPRVAAAPVAGALAASSYSYDQAVPRTVARPAAAGHQLVRAAGSPLSIEECRTKWKIACYTPLQYREAYDLGPLYKTGITGKGRTIVIVDSFGSPTVQHDLDVCSRQFGIPGTKVQVVKWGNVPKWDPKNADMPGTADGTGCYHERVDSWPSSDPLVTSVGGTQLHLDDAGRRTAPESVYDDSGAGGGGQSHAFTRPAFRNGVRNVVGGRRGTPDISMAAAVDGGAWIYPVYDPAATGWDVSGGTSESSPLFAGIVALADRAAGKRLGDIHEALYRLYGRSAYDRSTGIVDVDDGTDNSCQGVTGYTAVNGYDMATGVGTLDAARFVPALAREARRG